MRKWLEEMVNWSNVTCFQFACSFMHIIFSCIYSIPNPVRCLWCRTGFLLLWAVPSILCINIYFKMTGYVDFFWYLVVMVQWSLFSELWKLMFFFSNMLSGYSFYSENSGLFFHKPVPRVVSFGNRNSLINFKFSAPSELSWKTKQINKQNSFTDISVSNHL